MRRNLRGNFIGDDIDNDDDPGDLVFTIVTPPVEGIATNKGDGTFLDNGMSSGTQMGRWAWGSLLVDINNDGWRDAYVTNGFVTADNNNDL